MEHSIYYTVPERISVGGIEVAYRVKGDGPALVYLHGLGMTRRWLPFYEELSTSRRVLVPEHPGFGESDLPDWLDDFTDLVLHYAGLTDTLDLSKFDLVGYGFGAWLAAEFAAFYPERLRSLILISPIGVRTPGTPAPDLFLRSGRAPGDDEWGGHADEYRDYLVDGDDQETMFQNYAELSALARVAWNPRYDHKLDRRLARVSCPSLVLRPDDDRVVPTTQAARYVEILPHARLEVVTSDSGALGHAMIAQDPKAVARAITAFYDGFQDGEPDA
jgi:pimeloyl-ACP methyl ester carboxylesterase